MTKPNFSSAPLDLQPGARLEYPRTAGDQMSEAVLAFADELAREDNIVGLARHETTKPVMNTDVRPRVIFDRNEVEDRAAESKAQSIPQEKWAHFAPQETPKQRFAAIGRLTRRSKQ